MTIEIINMIAAGDYTFTATAPTAVTDIVIVNTDPNPLSGFEWEMHIVKSGGTKGVNTQILSTIDMNSTPMGFTGMPAIPPVVFVGSQIFVNSIGGLSEKWLLDTGDSIIIALDDSNTTGFIGSTFGQANASFNWVDNVIASMGTFGAPDPLRSGGTYPGVTGTSSSPASMVGTFDITVDGSTGAVTSVTVVTGGAGNAINDTITIPDAVLGSGGAAAFTMNVATLVNNKATVPCNLFINHILI